MSDNSEHFPHLQLRFVREGRASLQGGGKVSSITVANRENTRGHGRKLKSHVDLITTNWEEEKQEREEEDKPELPDSVSFILKVDPNSFEVDNLKSFGIEVVADLEQGYIIGASADTELSELRKKIENFINSQKGAGKVPEIWEILEGTKRPEYILSDSLKAEWNKISEMQEYIVDVGISCIDIKEQYSRCPKREQYKSDENFQKGVNKWLDKHKLSLEEWDDLYYHREQQLQMFIGEYEGGILRSVSGEVGISRLPDSFSCSGLGIWDTIKPEVVEYGGDFVIDSSQPPNFTTPEAVCPELVRSTLYGGKAISADAVGTS
ncbi:MAG: hypothetical protein F6K24_49045, partial [Okeania sp. SIO2D1]|nr:hypothetical protein [Okeania sp. SIO2D1]